MAERPSVTPERTSVSICWTSLEIRVTRSPRRWRLKRRARGAGRGRAPAARSVSRKRSAIQVAEVVVGERDQRRRQGEADVGERDRDQRRRARRDEDVVDDELEEPDLGGLDQRAEGDSARAPAASAGRGGRRARSGAGPRAGELRRVSDDVLEPGPRGDEAGEAGAESVHRQGRPRRAATPPELAGSPVRSSRVIRARCGCSLRRAAAAPARARHPRRPSPVPVPSPRFEDVRFAVGGMNAVVLPPVS